MLVNIMIQGTFSKLVNQLDCSHRSTIQGVRMGKHCNGDPGPEKWDKLQQHRRLHPTSFKEEQGKPLNKKQSNFLHKEQSTSASFQTAIFRIGIAHFYNRFCYIRNIFVYLMQIKIVSSRQQKICVCEPKLKWKACKLYYYSHI